MQTILIAEDDTTFRLGLATILADEGFSIVTAASGNATIECFLRETPDLVILDVMLPGRDGFEICRHLRARAPHVPIVLMSCRRTNELDQVCGFEGGADDYLIKPFGSRELIARIHARLRRSASADNGPQSCSFDDVHVDLRAQIVTRRGKRVLLTRMEYTLLACLINHKGQIISREELLRSVWGHTTAIRTRTVDTHILELRKKLERRSDHPAHIRSIRGTGYQFI